MSIPIKALSAAEIRRFVRSHAEVFAALLDDQPCGYDLEYDKAVSFTARLLVQDGPIFCELVSIGTGLSDVEVQLKPWPEVVSLGCKVIEETREAWRLAWPNGFLQAIIRDELREFSSYIKAATH